MIWAFICFICVACIYYEEKDSFIKLIALWYVASFLTNYVMDGI